MFQLQFGMPKLRSVSVAQSNTVLSLVLGALRCFYCPFKVHCSADNDNATKATKSCCKKLKICWAHSVNLHTAGNRTKSNTCFGLSSVLYMVATVVASAPLCAWDICNSSLLLILSYLQCTIFVENHAALCRPREDLARVPTGDQPRSSPTEPNTRP